MPPAPYRRDDRAWRAALGEPAACRVDVVTAQLISRTGGSLRSQVRDEHLCNLVVAGSGRLQVGVAAYALVPGTLFWVAPGVRFAFAADGGGLTWLNARFRLRHGDAVPCFAADHLLATGVGQLRRWFELWMADRRQHHPDAAPRFVHALALLWSDLRRPPRAGGLGSERRATLHAYLRRHARRRPGPADLARAIGLGAAHFRRIFRRTYGIAPRTWVLRERLALASDQLLQQPRRQVAAIAADLGWDDPALFSRQFRAAYGDPPARWRSR